MKGLYCCVLLSLFSFSVSAQTNGDYRSRGAGGNWNTVSTWQVFDGGAWVNLENSTSYPNVIPSNSSGAISIVANSTVTVNTSPVNVDQLSVQGNGSLIIASGGEMIIFDNTGEDLFIQASSTIIDPDTEEEISVPAGSCAIQSGGVLENRGQINSNTENLSIAGRYKHNQNSGSVPIAVWSSGSSTEIVGALTSGSITGLNQTFYDFIWEPSSQSTSRTLITGSNPGLTTISHNFEIRNTGGQALSLTTITTNSTTILGDLVISGSSRFNLGTSSNTTATVHGNVSISSSLSSTSLRITQTGSSAKLTVLGNLTISGSSDIELAEGNSSATPAFGTGSLELRGDLDLGGGLINVASSNASNLGIVTFAKNSTIPQTVTNSAGGAFNGRINYVISLNSHTNLGEIPLVGTGTLTLNGKLGVGSTHIDGAIQSGTTGGNLQLTLANRNFGTAATIVYNGTGPQYLGDAFPTDVNMEIANPDGVTNNNIGVTNVVADLRLTSGSFNIGNTNTLNIQSNFLVTSGTIGGSSDSDLIFSGSGTLNTLSFTTNMQEINNLTISRPTELVLGSDLTIYGNIDLPGGNLNFSGRTLTINGATITTNGTGLKSTLSTSNLVFGGSSFSGAVPFSGLGNQLNKLTFGTNGGSYTWNSTVVVNDSVKLVLGSLTHNSGLTMANNSDFLKAGGTISGVSPVVAGTDRYNVTYTGAGTTGVELPTPDSDALNNLTISSSGTVTLSSAIKVNGDLSLTGGVLDANSNAIEIVDDFIANATSDLTLTTVTFSGPSSEITGSNVLFDNLTVTGTVAVNVGGAGWRINGNLVNNGSLSVTSGTITFGGTTTISGSSICSFRTMRIAGTLNAPAQMNVGVSFIYESGTFNANNGTVNFTGASTTLSNVAGVTFHNILITGGLTSSPTLNLTGNFTDNGTFTRGTGNVRFTGTSTQLIGGTSETSFNDITITNVSGPPAVQVVSNKNLHGVLTLSAGTRFDPDGAAGTVVFTLRSTGDVFTSGVINDAAIAALPTGAVVDGNVNVQRYMALEGANSNRVYRYICSPVSNAPVSQLTDDFKISGTFTGTNQAGSQSMFGYNESVITDQNGNGLDINDGYFDFPANNVSETMDNGRGYAIFVYGNESPYTTNGNALWDVRGTINSGEVVFNSFTTLTASSNPGSDGWNMVGNPYPSTIDWDAATGWTKQGIANAIYMRNNGLASPVYATYINGEGLNGGSRYIPIGQAFQVRATSSPIDFRATENVKVAGQQATYFREITYDKIRVALASGNVQDEMVIRFTDAATEAFDPDWDAYKFPNYKLNLSSITDSNEKFAINSLPNLTCGRTIKLSMTDVLAGNYSLNFSEFESISPEMGIHLFDSYTATTINVREQTSYSFAVTADIHSYGDKRFELRFIGREIPDFNFIADDVCESAEAVISITDSEQGVSYRIMKNGTSLTDWQVAAGTGLTIRLNAAELAAGENTLSIQASIAGCESVYVDKALELNVVPLTEVEKVSHGSSCGSGRVVLSATGAVDGNYKWYETETDAAPIAGATSGTFTTPELSKSKTYYVSTINDLGCESARKPVQASIVNIDNVSISVSAESNILTSSSQSGNQWFLNGNLIPGANEQSIEVTETGLYEVEVTLKGCSTRASQEMIVLGTEGGKTNGILFYPNPVADVLYIELPDTRPAKGEVSTSAGQPIGSIDFAGGKAEFNFSGRAAGLYLVKVIQGNTVVHYKIIKK